MQDTRYKGVVSTGESGLSFGMSQFDVAASATARRLFQSALDEAVSNSRITKQQADDFFLRARTAGLIKSGKNFSKDELDIISKEVIIPYGNTISQADASHIYSAAKTVNSAIDTIKQHWNGSAGVFDTASGDQLMAVGHLLSWSNRTGNIDTFTKFLSGEKIISPKTGQILRRPDGTVLQIDHPPTLDDLREYLQLQKQFVNNPREFKNLEDNIRRGIDGIPAIDEIPWRFGDSSNDGRIAQYASLLLDGELSNVYNNSCFLHGTHIATADGGAIQIQNVKPGDLVIAYDGNVKNPEEPLVSKTVTRVFRNIATTIIDIRGIRCTPGHVFLTEGTSLEESRRFATIASILLEDGTLLEQDGTVIRARTGSRLDSADDAVVRVVYNDASSAGTLGSERHIIVRAGIPMPATMLADGITSASASTLAKNLEKHGVVNLPNITFRIANGAHHIACNWPEGSTPFDTHESRNWIVEADGQPYTPPWIRDLVEEDEQQGLRVVGALPTISSNAAPASLL